MDGTVPAYIEIEKHSDIKYEFDKTSSCLVVDRMLMPPFVYPFAYGFFPHTLAADGDELDVLIIRDPHDIQNNKTYEVYIIGALVMEDEKGMDEKILCVLPDEYETIKDIYDLNKQIQSDIQSFFSNYKKDVPDKWSKTYGYLNRHAAIELYERSKIV